MSRYLGRVSRIYLRQSVMDSSGIMRYRAAIYCFKPRSGAMSSGSQAFDKKNLVKSYNAHEVTALYKLLTKFVGHLLLALLRKCCISPPFTSYSMEGQPCPHEAFCYDRRLVPDAVPSLSLTVGVVKNFSRSFSLDFVRVYPCRTANLWSHSEGKTLRNMNPV